MSGPCTASPESCLIDHVFRRLVAWHRASDDQWSAVCPAHSSGRKQSLSFTLGTRGQRWVANCHHLPPCSDQQVNDALLHLGVDPGCLPRLSKPGPPLPDVAKSVIRQAHQQRETLVGILTDNSLSHAHKIFRLAVELLRDGKWPAGEEALRDLGSQVRVSQSTAYLVQPPTAGGKPRPARRPKTSDDRNVEKQQPPMVGSGKTATSDGRRPDTRAEQEVVDSSAQESVPLGGRAKPHALRPAPSDLVLCKICEQPLDPILPASGFTTHPCCDPGEVLEQWPPMDSSELAAYLNGAEQLWRLPDWHPITDPRTRGQR